MQPDPPPELSSEAVLAFLAMAAAVAPEDCLVRRSAALVSAFSLRLTPLPYTSAVFVSSTGSIDEACFAVRFPVTRSVAVSGFSFWLEVYLFMLFYVFIMYF